ncbi:MAG TPA: pyridoxamine 5'-phosphate oxidase family protein [Kaistia sp.]|nr:pyridoxamine 5'-phosphate oxidase family protein [Kaistia sp.]
MTETGLSVKTGPEARAKVFALVADAHIAMMANLGEHGRWHARPMATGKEPLDGALWFLTDSRSGKIEELEQEPTVLLAYSDEAAGRYVSISGMASISREPGKVRALWSEAARPWFPGGPDDPHLALIRVDFEEAEYWDAPSSAMVSLYGYAKAMWTDEKPDGDGEHGTVDFS